MKILIISNYFYPSNCIATFRINSFAKYFHEAGHSVTVITEGDRDETAVWNGCEVHYIKDQVITTSAKKSLSLRKKKWTIRNIIYTLQYRLALDPKLLWRYRTYKATKKLTEKKKFDVILSSYATLASHMIAYRLRKKGIEFYWIADMRDEMSQDPLRPFWWNLRMRPYERKILNSADLILSVSKPLVDDFKRFGQHDRVLEIRNGYDYDEVYDSTFQPVYTMAYTGSFYRNHKPMNWFKALSELIAAGDIPADIRVNIIGSFSKLPIPENLLSNVFQITAVNHEEAIRMSLEADTLVLVHPKGRKGVYTGKLFDYLATNKPILALCDPDDVIAELLEETKAGFAVDEENIDEIKRMILHCYHIWQNKEVLPRDWERIRQYTRKNQVQILCEYLSREEALKQ